MMIDLTGPLHSGMWSYAPSMDIPPFEQQRWATIEERGWEADWFAMPTLAGTYLETAKHLIHGAPSIDQIPLERFFVDATIARIPRNAREHISVADLEAAAASLEPGDALLVQTGWEQHRDNSETFVLQSPHFDLDSDAVDRRSRSLDSRRRYALFRRSCRRREPGREHGALWRGSHDSGAAGESWRHSCDDAGGSPCLPIPLVDSCGAPCRAIFTPNDDTQATEKTERLTWQISTGTDPIPSSSTALREPIPTPRTNFTCASRTILDLLQPEIDKPKVTLKPNVVHGVSPDSGITVHPGFLRGIAEYLIDSGIAPGAISVAEGGGGEESRDMREHYANVGFDTLADELGVNLVDLNADDYVRVDIPTGHVFKQMPIGRTVWDPDAYFINIPKMRTHNLGITTISIKNLQGIVVPLEERHMCTLFPRYDGDRGGNGLKSDVLDSHERWAHKICDISLARTPDLNIVDALVPRDGTGFRNGNDRPMGIALGQHEPDRHRYDRHGLDGHRPGECDLPARGG